MARKTQKPGARKTPAPKSGERWITVPDRIGWDNREPPVLGLDRELLNALTRITDLDRKLVLGKAHVAASFQEQFGQDVGFLTAKIDTLTYETGQLDAEIRAIDRQLPAEPLEIPAAFENGCIEAAEASGEETAARSADETAVGDAANDTTRKAKPPRMTREIPVWRWQLRDQVAALFATTALGGILAASYLGAEATLSDAQLPIFDMNPYLPAVLAVLPASASIAFKFIGQVFLRTDQREAFRKWTAIAGGVAFAAWIPMFSGLFEGLSGVFDPFAAPNHLLGWGFNTTHIVAEVLIGAGLFAHLDALMAKYAPSHKIPNPARPPLIKARTAKRAELDALSAELGAVTGARDSLFGMRDRAQVLVETAIEVEHDKTPPKSLL